MTPALISLQNITFSYGAGRPVLRDLDLELRAGDRLALLGANGSGKTTLLHLIVGLLKPQAGTVVAFGRARRQEPDFQEVRRRAGLLFQDPDDQLFCPTVEEDVAFGPLNMGLPPTAVRRRVRETLDQLGLTGFETRITYKLSGGEKRLVSLATVLAMEPEVLLLDEPSAGLDPETRRRLIEVLGRLPQALLVVSHDREFLAAVTQRALRLEHGRIVPGERLPERP